MNEDLNFLLSGGPVMWPLFLCGVIAVAVMIDRFLTIGVTVRDNRRLVATVESAIAERRYDDAISACDSHGGPVGAMLARGLRARELDLQTIERNMQEYALRQIPLMAHRLAVLDTIVTLAPLLGLLGTITGMIRAFHIAGQGGLNVPTAITGGVAEALIATSAGLTIAIVALPAYNFLTELVKNNISEMEWRATQLLNRSQAPLPNPSPEERGQIEAGQASPEPHPEAANRPGPPSVPGDPVAIVIYHKVAGDPGEAS